MNQQLLVEEFLKEKMRQHTEKMMREYPTEDPKFLNRCCIRLYYVGKKKGWNGYDDKGRLSLSILLNLRCGFFGLFEKCIRRCDKGKELFEWSKVKCREWGIPVSTFKTIKETREIAKRLTEEWYDKFETIEEVNAWFEEEEFCLK